MKRASNTDSQAIDNERRRLLGATGAGAIAITFGGIMAGASCGAGPRPPKTLRGGFVGTGRIANAMVSRIKQANNAELVAVSSRKIETAKAFANKHILNHAFDSWAKMIAWDGVDAIYCATPTSVREEICVAAANGGKHVLGEKPFANLPSLSRITAACRENGVGFMDGTHFPHHPRTEHIKANLQQDVGWPWSVASAVQFRLTDKNNIRMRPVVEYTTPDNEIASVNAYMRRHRDTNAAISASGVIVFRDGSTTTFNCAFESGASIQDLRISGKRGVIKLDDFLRARRRDYLGVYELRSKKNKIEKKISSSKSGPTLMWEDFAAMVGDPKRIEASIDASERTQKLLDAIWQSAMRNG